VDRLKWTWRWIEEHWPKLTLAAFTVFILAPVAVEWWEARQAETKKQEREAAIDRVNTGASIAGALLATAYRSCSRIGIDSIERCADYEGKLLQEIGAPMSAQMALGQRKEYNDHCLTLYDAKYCNGLLNRAFQLSLAEPEQRSSD